MKVWTCVRKLIPQHDGMYLPCKYRSNRPQAKLPSVLWPLLFNRKWCFFTVLPWFLLINVFFFVLPCPFFNCFSVIEVILFSSSSKVFLFLLPSLCKQSLLCRSTLPFSSLTLLFCSIPSSNRSPLHFNGTFFRTPALLPINFFLARSSFLHTAPSVESGCVSALLPNQRLLFTFCAGFDSKSSFLLYPLFETKHNF